MLAGCMVLGLLVGLGWASVQPKTYTAQASVLLAPVPTYVSSETGRPPREVTIDTDARLVTGARVAQAVAEATGVTADAVPERLEVTATPLSRVLHIAFTAGSVDAAADGATAAAEAFVGARREALGALSVEQARQISLRIADLQGRLSTQGKRQLASSLDDPLVDDIADLRARAAELETVRAVPAEVSRRALPPVVADTTEPEVPLTSGAMTGLLVGCLLGRSRGRRGVKLRNDVPAESRDVTGRSPANGSTLH
jgi:uncharacterized protein involved in exopolysaccharide biosynthesis